jgi:hypothetical protein
MIVIDQNGRYAYVAGTKVPQTSDHPVYKARVALALPQGSWLYSPTSGHQLARFARVKETQAKIDEFQKELVHYLSKYPAVAKDRLVARGSVTLSLEIKQEVLNGV